MRLGAWARRGTMLVAMAMGAGACTVVRAPQGDGAPIVSGRVRQVGPDGTGAALRIATSDLGGASGRAVSVLVPAGTPLLDPDGQPVDRVRLGDDVLVWSTQDAGDDARVVATMIVTTPSGFAVR